MRAAKDLSTKSVEDMASIFGIPSTCKNSTLSNKCQSFSVSVLTNYPEYTESGGKISNSLSNIDHDGKCNKRKRIDLDKKEALHTNVDNCERLDNLERTKEKACESKKRQKEVKRHKKAKRQKKSKK